MREKIMGNCKIIGTKVVGFLDEFVSEITIPDGIEVIGERAFAKCYGLKHVSLPQTLIHIEDYAFYRCSALKSIIAPINLKTIGYRSFAYCNKLDTVHLENSKLELIGELAFSHCEGLTAVYCPETLIKICSGAFLGCKALETLELLDGIKVLEDDLYSAEKITNLYLPNSLIHIERMHRANIEHLYISSEQKEHFDSLLPKKSKVLLTPYFDYTHTSRGVIIGGCTPHSSEVIIPATIDGKPVVGIQSGAFAGTILKSITLPHTLKQIGDRAFEDTQLESIIIPDSVEEIGEYCFGDCEKLVSVRLPDSLSIIKSGMFSGCSALKQIKIPESVFEIHDFAFAGCTSLSAVVLPDEIESIFSFAFDGCDCLTHINISDYIVYIGNYAFSRSVDTPIHIAIRSIDGVEFEDSAFDSLKHGIRNAILYCSPNTPAHNYATERVLRVKSLDEWAF